MRTTKLLIVSLALIGAVSIAIANERVAGTTAPGANSISGVDDGEEYLMEWQAHINEIESRIEKAHEVLTEGHYKYAKKQAAAFSILQPSTQDEFDEYMNQLTSFTSKLDVEIAHSPMYQRFIAGFEQLLAIPTTSIKASANHDNNSPDRAFFDTYYNEVHTDAESESTFGTMDEIALGTAHYVRDFVREFDPVGNARFDLTFLIDNADLTGYAVGTTVDNWTTEMSTGSCSVQQNVERTHGYKDTYYEYSVNGGTYIDNSKFVVKQQLTQDWLFPAGTYNIRCHAFTNTPSDKYFAFVAKDVGSNKLFKGSCVSPGRLNEQEVTISFTQASSANIGLMLDDYAFTTSDGLTEMGMGYVEVYKVDSDMDELLTQGIAELSSYADNENIPSGPKRITSDEFYQNCVNNSSYTDAEKLEYVNDIHRMLAGLVGIERLYPTVKAYHNKLDQLLNYPLTSLRYNVESEEEAQTLVNDLKAQFQTQKTTLTNSEASIVLVCKQSLEEQMLQLEAIVNSYLSVFSPGNGVSFDLSFLLTHPSFDGLPEGEPVDGWYTEQKTHESKVMTDDDGKYYGYIGGGDYANKDKFRLCQSVQLNAGTYKLRYKARADYGDMSFCVDGLASAALPTTVETGELLFTLLSSQTVKFGLKSSSSTGWRTAALYSVELYEVEKCVAINETNFPDARFREIVKQYSADDVILTADEIANVTTIGIFGQGIASLKGIEYFTELTELYCYDNQLTTLDLSANTKLTRVSCYNNKISGENMEALINSLPVKANGFGDIIVIATGDDEHNTFSESLNEMAEQKKWIAQVYDVDSNTFSVYQYSLDADGFVFVVNAAEKTATLTAYKGSEEDIEIPSSVTTVNGAYRVTAIVEGAFANRDFNSVSIYTTLERIDPTAFRNVSNFIVQTTGNANDSNAIHGELFKDCTFLKNIVLEDGVSGIGEKAFMNCIYLQVGTLPSSVENIGMGAFGGTALTSIAVDEENETFEALNGCFGIVRKADNTLVAANASTVIPASVTAIEGAYAYDDTMDEFVIPCNITTIGPNAFRGNQLRSVEIPSSVTKIYRSSFAETDFLTDVYVGHLTPLSFENDDWSVVPFVYSSTERQIKDATLHVPFGALDAYNWNYYDWYLFPNRVERGIYTDDVIGCAGQLVWLPIYITNAKPFSGCSFELGLPEGISFEKVILDPEGLPSGRLLFLSGATLDFDYESNVVSGYTTENVSVGEGALFYVGLRIDRNMNKGDYNVSFTGVSFWGGEVGQTEGDQFNVVSKISVVESGDANGDGSVTASDIPSMLNAILNNQYNGGADVNGDGKVTISDITILIDQLLPAEQARLENLQKNYTLCSQTLEVCKALLSNLNIARPHNLWNMVDDVQALIDETEGLIATATTKRDVTNCEAKLNLIQTIEAELQMEISILEHQQQG